MRLTRRGWVVLTILVMLLSLLLGMTADIWNPIARKARKQIKQMRTERITEPQEDESGWNCMVHGDRNCGPDWVLWEDYELSPGHSPDCMAKVDDTTLLHCADGTVTTT